MKDVSERALRRIEVIIALMALLAAGAWAVEVEFVESSGNRSFLALLRFLFLPGVGASLAHLHATSRGGGLAYLVLWAWAFLMLFVSLLTFLSAGLLLLPSAFLLLLAAGVGWAWDFQDESNS